MSATPYPYKTIPPCVSNTPDSPHKAGVLLVTATLPTADSIPAPADFLNNIEMRCCVDCLDDVCETLKDGGYNAIRITAPEAPAYGSWRR